MSKKEPFNDAAQGKEDARNQQIAEWERECARDLEMRREEQRRKRPVDMEKARQQVLREHNRLDCRPAYARRKALTTAQLEERASRVVEAQNLRELNAIRAAYKEKIAALEMSARQERSASVIERTRSPREIKTIFNGLPKDRDGPERAR